MADSKFSLGDYVEVKDRIPLFYAAFPEGALMTGEVRMVEADGASYVAVQAFAYRSPEDLHPGVGWSWMRIPGVSSYTKGSELENTETSAWGRAIASLNIGIGKSIASANEVRAKSVTADVGRSDDGGLIGIAEKGDRNTSDFEAHLSAEGHNLGFRLRGDKGGILVRTVDPLASQLYAQRYEVIGKRVTVWGRMITVPGEGKARAYQAVEAERVSIPGIGVLPTAEAPAGELTEAESEAIWTEINGKA